MGHLHLTDRMHLADATAIVAAADPQLAANLAQGSAYQASALSGPHKIPGTMNPLAMDNLDGTWQDDTWTMLTVSWTWQSRMRGSRPRSATILEITTGLWVQQYVVRKALTQEEAANIAHLIAHGLLPQAGSGWEL